MLDVILPAMERGILTRDRIELNGQAVISGIDQLDKVLSIDQNPVGHTVRSDASTYVDVLTHHPRIFCLVSSRTSQRSPPSTFQLQPPQRDVHRLLGHGLQKSGDVFLAPCQNHLRRMSWIKTQPC